MKTIRAVWTAIITLAAAVVALAAYLLMSAGGSSPTEAILTSAGAFAGTVLALLAIAHFLTGASS
ncbi:hypothetical protein [Nonomuraea sp. NPDC049758]|uniref:hypothetical protein n=1 Tax=Nonomuraea sp. NPDC049758 TaxID=3154360 RepID=UPI00342395AA